jgi:superfamily II DNA or RNA helicase
VHDLILHKKDEAYIRVTGEQFAIQELSEHFTFFVPGYKFMPAFKNKIWDGKIRLLDTRTGLVYHGLINYIEDFCKTRNYSIAIDPSITGAEEFSVIEAEEFISTLNLPHKVRDYQLKSFVYSIRNKRLLILSPTASGKSLIIYLIIRYLQTKCKKGLLIVPTISLVAQMYKDFEEYGYDSSENCHMIYAGKDKDSKKFLNISTWQSIYNQPKKYFEQYDFIIGDEAHQFKAKSLTSILAACVNAKYRIGTTGTLDGTQTHRLVLEGLFGKVYKAVTTSNLIDNNQLSKFKIKCLVLKYPEPTCKLIKGSEYQAEMDFIVRNEARNSFIKNLTLSLEGNTLVLFQYVEKHGKVLFDMIKEKAGDRKVFFVFGGTDVDTREAIRAITEKETNAIIIASFGTFSTGVNIRNLHNVIFTSSSKSIIRVLQSIGRVLRLGDNKEEAILFDIADDLRIGKHNNHTLKHFVERVKIYDSEKFKYKFYNIELKNG